MADADRDDYTTPTLMVSARGTYAQSIRAQLHRIGAFDLPANGVFILAGIDTAGGPRQDFPAELGVTKQAVSQAIDVLVNRGYLTRSADPGDRRAGRPRADRPRRGSRGRRAGRDRGG